MHWGPNGEPTRYALKRLTVRGMIAFMPPSGSSFGWLQHMRRSMCTVLNWG
ncbi:hypothetical protein ABIA06_001519 [Bradyrhizobium yuanmingense]